MGRGASILVARVPLATTSNGNPPKSTHAASFFGCFPPQSKQPSALPFVPPIAAQAKGAGTGELRGSVQRRLTRSTIYPEFPTQGSILALPVRRGVSRPQSAGRGCGALQNRLAVTGSTSARAQSRLGGTPCLGSPEAADAYVRVGRTSTPRYSGLNCGSRSGRTANE